MSSRFRSVGSSMSSSSATSSATTSMKHFRGVGGSSSQGHSLTAAAAASSGSSPGGSTASGSSGSGPYAATMTTSLSAQSSISAGADCQTSLHFAPLETMHQWKRMLECDEFVGARRSKHTAVAYMNAIYVFGGDNGKNMLNDLIRFDVRDKSWGRAFATGTPPAARYHHSAVVRESSMFVFGGYTGDIHSNSNLSNRNDLFEYRFQNGQWLEWKFTGKAPVPRSAHGAAVYDNKLWIYAGYDGNVRLNDMWTMPLKGDSREWVEVEQLGDCPPTCCNFPVAVARDCMYVFSGQSGLQITNALFEFNFKSKTWRRITNEHILRVTPAPPARRYGHTMVAHEQCLYVFGGSADSSLPNDLHCYDLVAERWSTLVPESESQVPSGRVFHASAVIANAMYTFGGTVDNNVRSGDMFQFQFSTYPRCTLHEDFDRLLRVQQYCDVDFVVGRDGDKSIAGHMAIVAARSTYLRERILVAKKERLAVLCGEPEKKGFRLEVRLPMAEPESFELLLSYIYTDRIDFDVRHNSRIVILVMDIYLLAMKFCIRSLEQVCLQYLEIKISKDNVLDALYNADKMCLNLIKEFCLAYIVKEDHIHDIVMSDDFEALEKPLMVEVIRKRFNPVKTELRTDIIEGTTLENDMAVFLKINDPDFCDIELVLDEHVIPAHKSVLAARCTYFQAMFRSFHPVDNRVSVQIGDIAPSLKALNSLLRYIYYGEKKMPAEDSLYLFQAPNFYGFTNNRLQAFCKYNLEHHITCENVLQILEASDKMHVLDIKQHALRMIVRDFAQVVPKPQLKFLSRELLLEIIQAMAETLAVFHIDKELATISIQDEL